MPKSTVQEHNIDDEDRALLAPEELAALQGDEDDDDPDAGDEDDPDAGEGGEGGDGDEDEDDEGDDDADGGGDPAGDKAKPPAGDDKDKKPAAKTDAAGEGDEDDTDEPDPRMPQYKIDEEALKAARATVDGIDAKYEALAKQFSDGDIDETEYHKQNRSLAKEEREAQKLIDRAEIYEEVSRANRDESWDAAQDRYFSRPENAVLLDELVFPSMQVALNKVRATPEAEGKTYSWLLKKAGQMVKEKIGYVETPDLKGGGKDKQTPAQQEIQRRKAKRDDMPPTLAHKPAADGNANEYTGKFAHLSGLAGMDLEDAVASMSEADQREWAEKG